MTHRLSTNYAKNYCNRTLIVKVIVENVVTCFLGHGVDHTDNKLSTHTVYLVVSEPSEVGASELPGRHVWAISSRDCFQ